MKATIKADNNCPLELQEQTDLTNWVGVTFLAPVLVYPVALLQADGFVSSKMLVAISQHNQVLYGVFGGFIDVDSLRCHLVFPCQYAADYQLSVLDWEIVEWTTKTLIRMN